MSHVEFERHAFDGLSLYFQLWKTESESRGVICLVHGLGEHSGRYTDWALLLDQANYSLLTFDLRGHGKSGGQRGHVSSFEDYSKDTDLLLEEARERFPGVPIFLYGHSLGALIVTQYVLSRKPEINGVIISALSNRTSLQEQKAKVMLSKILVKAVPRMSLSSGLIPATISRDAQVVARYVNDPMVHNQVTVGWGKSALDSIAWTEKHAHEWVLPVLIMHGEMDQLGYSKGSVEFAGKIKGDCTLKVWPGMFHEVHNEPDKKLVFDYLKNWLDNHCSA